MPDILSWPVFGFLLAVTVALSVGAVCCSEKPSSNETEEELIESKGGER